MIDLATLIVWALLAFGLGLFLAVFALALWRHLSWSHRLRRRIGWYT